MKTPNAGTALVFFNLFSSSFSLTIGRIVVMYIGDRSGRPSKIVTKQ
jgi:hypothetical protein